MRLLEWLFSGVDRNPEPPLPLRLAVAGGRVAAMRANGELWLWSRDSGERLSTLISAGGAVALSPDGQAVVGGDGVLHRAEHSAPAAFEGVCAFVGEELLRVGWDKLTLGSAGAARISLPHALGAPSDAMEVLVGPRAVAMVDPAWDKALVLDPASGSLYAYAGGRGPIQAACWLGERLAVVQEGVVFVEGQGEERRPHALQTLAVASRAGELVSVGLDARDRYELRDGALLALPGGAPERPWLGLSGRYTVAQTRAGVAVVADGAVHVLELPLRRGRRPALLAPPVLVEPSMVLLGLWPPALYRLSDLTCALRFSD